MRKTYEYRLYPTKKQETALLAALEECRWLYNHLLAQHKDTYEQTGKGLSLYAQQAAFPQLKRDRKQLTAVHSQVLQNVAVRVDLAYKAFFRRCKEGGDPGYPRFKGYGRYDSLTYPQSGFKMDEQGKLFASGIGHIKIILHRPLKGKGTTQRRKHRKVVAWVHERTAFRRENFTHQESRTIVNQYGVIAVEDLQVNRMVHNHCLAKSIQDVAWSQFFSMIACKAEEAGRKYLAVNPAYTSQDCSRCHHRQKMPLSERIYHCPCCLLSLDRDLNAAINILALGLQCLGLSREAPGLSRGE